MSPMPRPTSMSACTAAENRQAACNSVLETVGAISSGLQHKSVSVSYCPTSWNNKCGLKSFSKFPHLNICSHPRLSVFRQRTSSFYPPTFSRASQHPQQTMQTHSVLTNSNPTTQNTPHKHRIQVALPVTTRQQRTYTRANANTSVISQSPIIDRRPSTIDHRTSNEHRRPDW